jgi:hypothetical protein
VDIGFAVLHGLFWLTINLADQAPLLLAVDDAHWADDASLRWLAYLTPRLDGPSVSLAVALRTDEPASDSPVAAEPAGRRDRRSQYASKRRGRWYRRAGRRPRVHVWTVKDGKAPVFLEYPGDQQMEDEFWSSHEWAMRRPVRRRLRSADLLMRWNGPLWCELLIWCGR